MVERFNRTLLQLLKTYVTSQHDWEIYLPHVLYAYRTSQHTETRVSPFLLLYGRQPAPCQFATQLGYDLLSYPAHLQARLAELQNFVHTNLTQAAHLQRSNYDNHTMESTFILGDPVCLSIPTMGKLDPRWEGEWMIESVKGSVTIEICDGKRTKVVHSNRLQHHYIPGQRDTTKLNNTTNEINHLKSPSVEHVILPPFEQNVSNRYPQRQRRPPDCYRP